MEGRFLIGRSTAQVLEVELGVAVLDSVLAGVAAEDDELSADVGVVDFSLSLDDLPASPFSPLDFAPSALVPAAAAPPLRLSVL